MLQTFGLAPKLNHILVNALQWYVFDLLALISPPSATSRATALLRHLARKLAIPRGERSSEGGAVQPTVKRSQGNHDRSGAAALDARRPAPSRLNALLDLAGRALPRQPCLFSRDVQYIQIATKIQCVVAYT